MPLRNPPQPDGLLAAGRITGCYGVKGWVRVQAFTEEPLDLLDFPGWWLDDRPEPRPVVIDEGRWHGKGLVVHIDGLDDRTQAEALRGRTLWVRQEALPTLEEDEFYWHQLQGLEVWCLDRNELETEGADGRKEHLLGRVDHLLETGANDVLVVRPSAGSLDDRERLIPYLPGDVVLDVDLEIGRMQVDWYLEE
jgi:16S rRNA processing protein RimM